MEKVMLFTSSSSTSSRKAVEWFQENGIEYIEHRVTPLNPLSREQVLKILKTTLNGFSDVVSVSSKTFKLSGLTTDEDGYIETTTDDLISKIIETPKLLRFPIMIKGNNQVVGFRKDDISVFTPQSIRQNEMASIIGPSYKHNGGMYRSIQKSISIDSQCRIVL